MEERTHKASHKSTTQCINIVQMLASTKPLPQVPNSLTGNSIACASIWVIIVIRLPGVSADP